MDKKAALTIDLDTIASDIAGAGGPAADLRRLSYAHAVPRLLELLDSAGIKATFFAVGVDAADPECAALLRRIALEGHEVANHSLSHDRNLPLKTPAEIRRDLLEADRLIAAAAGKKPRGFRAPGAVLSADLLRAVADAGYDYDSSVNASFIYNLSKAAYGAFTGAKLPALYASGVPDGPYRPSAENFLERAARGISGPVEFPLTVIPLFPLPFMNYFLMRLGPLGKALTALTASRRHFINYVLHDHELLTAEDFSGTRTGSGLTAAWLGKDLVKRINFIEYTLRTLKRSHSFATLETYAGEIRAEG